MQENSPYNPAERRQDPRFAVHLVGTGEALYRRSLEKTYQDPSLQGQDQFKIEVVNVSQGGLLVAFDPEVSGGDVIRLTFRHPESKVDLVYEGRIQWMRRNAAPAMGRYFAGISFSDRNDPAVLALVDYASRVSPVPEP